MASGSLPGGYRIAFRTPPVADYLRLRRDTGLSPFTERAARTGLASTFVGVTLEHEQSTVGMGRVIGDGGTAFQIVDIAVEPDHQGKGLGKRIMAALVAHIHANAPTTAYISLIADGDARHLYAKFGFTPVTPASIGMGLWLAPSK